jgi:NADH-quinone oxidoreductase subunit J
MSSVFYVAAAVAVFSTFMVVTRLNAVHALLYLIVSFFSVALIFFTLGAPFAAALEVIIYAGAIMVLFVFAIMMANLGPGMREQERKWLDPKGWIGPSILAVILLAELTYLLADEGKHLMTISEVTPKQIGLSLFGPYLLGVELASMLLLTGLVGAYHLGRRPRRGGAREGDPN